MAVGKASCNGEDLVHTRHQLQLIGKLKWLWASDMYLHRHIGVYVHRSLKESVKEAAKCPSKMNLKRE